MANGRLIVAPPLFTPLSSGLLAVAQDATATAAEGRWPAGITYKVVCAQASATWDECLVVTGSGESPEPPAKEASSEYDFRGATPFTVFEEIDCSPVGSWNEIEADVRRALTQSEGWQVERAFWTGIAAAHDGTGPDVVHPHLAADAELIDDTNITLQTAASPAVTGTVDIVEGLSRLEQELGDCYHGRGVIHVTLSLLNAMVAQHLVTNRAGIYTTANGHQVAVGAGYTGSAPDGSTTENIHWMYATGAVFYFRGEVTAFRRDESFDRSVNTVKAIAERTYVVGWDCCHIGVPVTLGGEPAGEPGTPSLYPSV